MKRNKKILILGLLVFAATMSFGQRRGDKPMGKQNKAKKMQQMEAQKIAYISSELALTSAEAERFWPVYNAYQENLQNERKSRRQESANYDDMSNSEAAEVLDMHLQSEYKALDEKKKFIKDLQNCISNNQILQLWEAEKSFRKSAFDKFKQNRKRGRG